MTRLFFPIILIFLYSCSTMHVTADYDKDVDFATYKTFSLLNWRTDNSKLVNDFDKQRLEKAVVNEMTARGYQYLQTGGNLAVSIFVILEDKTDYTSYTNYYGGYGYYYGSPWGYGPGRTTVSRYDYTQGTLIFNVFDAQQKKLIWQGTAVGEVDDNPQNREEGIPEAVSEVFMRYPVQKSE